MQRKKDRSKGARKKYTDNSLMLKLIISLYQYAVICLYFTKVNERLIMSLLLVIY